MTFAFVGDVGQTDLCPLPTLSLLPWQPLRRREMSRLTHLACGQVNSCPGVLTCRGSYSCLYACDGVPFVCGGREVLVTRAVFGVDDLRLQIFSTTFRPIASCTGRACVAAFDDVKINWWNWFGSLFFATTCTCQRSCARLCT